MRVYFDTAYIAKCYVNEADSTRVRSLLRKARGGVSSVLCVPEIAAVLLRHVREGALAREQAATLHEEFLADLDDGVWQSIPMSDAFLRRTVLRVASLPSKTYIRAGDAIHLAAASEAGFTEVWTNDRHLLAAAPLFALTGRSV